MPETVVRHYGYGVIVHVSADIIKSIGRQCLVEISQTVYE